MMGSKRQRRFAMAFGSMPSESSTMAFSVPIQTM